MPAPPRLHTLTSLRFFAALAIVVYHLLPAWTGTDIAHWPALARHLLTLACVGLPFFYALSGFVLYYVYRHDAPADKNKLYLFFGKRFARLAPIFYLSLLVAFPLVLNRWTTAEAAKAFAWNAAFLSAWVPESLALNFPTWSIAVEMFCYLIFPFALGPVAKLTRGEAWAGLALCFAAGAAAQVIGVLLHPDLLRWPWVAGTVGKATTDFFQLHPIVHLPEFLFGVILARAWELRKRAEEKRADLALGGGLAGILLLIGSGIPWPFLMMTSFLFLPLIGVVIWGGAGTRGASLRWLELPAVVLLGETTYAIYSLHMPLSQWFARFVPTQNSPYVFFLVFFALLLAVAVALHLYFEQPVRRWLVRASERRWGRKK